MRGIQMYLLCFNVPETHVDHVKKAIFAAGAGKNNHYSEFAWQVLGEGQFKPLSGSKPFIGKVGEVETVTEYKVETLCDEAHIKNVITALKEAHPYEMPSYQVIKIEDF
jgi:structural toxin protein (hemagglutinin/hemolysin) RtxA